MADTEKRIGWGESISLSSEQADAARDLVASMFPLIGTRTYNQWSILRPVLIPPVEACQPNRQAIEASSDWLSNLDSPPEVGDPGYWEFEKEASGVLHSAIDAFESRPKGCEMEMNGDKDCFSCDRCNFDRSTDTSY